VKWVISSPANLLFWIIVGFIVLCLLLEDLLIHYHLLCVSYRVTSDLHHYVGMFLVVSDGNKSLYLDFVGVVFSQHLGLLLEQLGQQHLDCFVRTAAF
jgi:hypothetical protein